MEHGVSEMF
jgi:hypothetical protein